MENISASPHVLSGMGPNGPPLPVAGGLPGLEILQGIFQKLGFDSNLLMTIGMSVTMLTSLLTFLSYAFGSFSSVTGFISANLVSSATVHSSDVTYLYIMRWLAVNKISTDCRLFWVTSRRNLQSSAARRYSSYPDGTRRYQEDDEDDDGIEGDTEDDSLGPRLKYSPAPGFSYFWHKGKPIVIHRTTDTSWSQFVGDLPDETMVITTIGRSPAFLRDLLAEARREYLEAQRHKTIIYGLAPSMFAAQRSIWDQGRPKPSRDISTVIMPSEKKQLLLKDLKEYLNPATARWYAQRGLPYRRGYLFYGPPGTGKTSLSIALAGELKLPLFILSLSTGSVNDESLTLLFVGLPRRCIVLLEDIDCAGVRTRDDGYLGLSSDESDSEEDEPISPTSCKEKKSTGSTKQSRSEKNSDTRHQQRSNRNKGSVSFSGLLNAIDGVASHEGRILIMTTNHRERLDPALIRPGRVDVEIELGYADSETVAEVFRGLYQEMKSEKDSQDINFKTQQFAELVPPGQFTPAEIQGFLMGYKGQPQKALDNVQEWLDAKRSRGRRKKSRTKRRNVPVLDPIVPPSPPSTAPSIASQTPTTTTHSTAEHTRLMVEATNIIQRLQDMVSSDSNTGTGAVEVEAAVPKVD